MTSTRSTCGIPAFLFVVLAPAVAFAGVTADGLSLQVNKVPATSNVTLQWTGGLPSFEVYRHLDSQGVIAPENLLGTTSQRAWTDLPLVGNVFYYQVLSPCLTDPQIACDTQAVNPAVVARGAYPDLAVDSTGDVHIVYVRADLLYYNKWDATSRTWNGESSVGLSVGDVERSDPEIVIDSFDRPHVMAGARYAYWNGTKWIAINPGASRDTAMAIDSHDNVFILRRGGQNGGWLGLRVRFAGSSSFTALPDPDIANGLPLGRNEHVYGHIFVSPLDDSLHVVYRHGAPTDFAYRGSTDSGQNWFGGGIGSEDFEAPSGVAAADGTIYAVSGGGGVYRRSRTPSTWTTLGRPVTAGSRDLPALAVDNVGNVYTSSFGGGYNVRSNGAWAGQKTLPNLSALPLGYAEVAGGPGEFAYVIWEEGATVNDDTLAGTSDILFATISSDGTVGLPTP